LTERERSRKDIDKIYEYRLPTDAEWSLMVGLREGPEKWPMELDGKKKGFYWGNSMPPPNGIANFADETAELQPNEVIHEYLDHHSYTAPVGTFRPRKVGDFSIYDLEGNVLEWVADDYTAEGKWNTARGGSWRSYSEGHLTMSMRWGEPKTAKPLDDLMDDFGFRVVLAKVPVRVEKEADEETPPKQETDPPKK
jgi:formylglycine-generating enzyme required for sulfatase activity